MRHGRLAFAVTVWPVSRRQCHRSSLRIRAMRCARVSFWPGRFRFGAALVVHGPRDTIGHGIAPDLQANVKATLVELNVRGSGPREEANGE
jgi:hypothetical protein